MKKRLLAWLLILVMVLSFTACGSKEEAPSAQEEIKAEAPKEEIDNKQVEEIKVDAEENSNFNPTGYPVVNEPVTLTIMAPITSERGGDWETNTAWKELEEVTGVKLELITVDANEWKEKLSLTLASGKLPDIILDIPANTAVRGLTEQDLYKNVSIGNFIDLTPYIEAYGVNVKKYMDTMEGFTQSITTPSGEIASLPVMQMMTEKGKCPISLLTVNQPWLDKLGLDIPTTDVEFYEMLKAFKEQDPNGNGLQDEIPILALNVDRFYELWGMFGVLVQQNNYAYTVGEEVKFSPFMPEFKVGLEYMAKLYQEGLIDPNIYTTTAAEVLATGSGEVDVCGVTIHGAAFAVVGEERNLVHSLIPELDAEGYDGVWLSRTPSTAGAFMITKDCEYPEIALRVWDYMYSEEGGKLSWMGPEENYTWNDDGTWNWNLAEGETVESVRATKTLQTSFAPGCSFPQDWFKQNNPTEGIANEYRVLMGTEYADNLRLVCPNFAFDEEVAKELSIIKTDLDNYVNTTIAQFITGELDIEADWAAFEKQCQSLRVDEYISIMQDAYDVYLGK